MCNFDQRGAGLTCSTCTHAAFRSEEEWGRCGATLIDDRDGAGQNHPFYAPIRRFDYCHKHEHFLHRKEVNFNAAAGLEEGRQRA